MVLCGLALSGANRAGDVRDHLAGVLTAEELAAVDLAGCELAVLSACDSGVGVLRAGQGLASLRTALHAAGARSTITSLWPVPDESTRDLMVEFYRRVWSAGEPKASALWQAKQTLRARRVPMAHWGGWVFSGDPR
jgi:CHAT domain-containing protein